jgi:hypothetical protein
MLSGMQELLSKLGRVHGGYQSRTAIVQASGGAHRLVQLRDLLGGGKVAWHGVLRFHAQPSPADTVLAAGDVLFQAKGAANTAIALGEVPAGSYAAGCFFVIRPAVGRVLPAYLAWYINQPSAQRYIQQRAGQGVLTPNVPRAVLESLPVLVPPLAVQQRMADLLALLAEEQQLVHELGRQRRVLVDAVCRKAAEHNSAEN